jgi:hypothetical protein
MPFGLETILGFVIAWLVLFLGVIPFVIGHVGGWAKLAAEYRLSGRFEGTRWWFQDITLRGWCGYNGCASVGASAEGLYLNTFFFVSHPPLFIPWTDLSVTRREVKFLGFRIGMVEFAAARVPDVRIALKESLLKKFAAAHGRALSSQPSAMAQSASADSSAWRDSPSREDTTRSVVPPPLDSPEAPR